MPELITADIDACVTPNMRRQSACGISKSCGNIARFARQNPKKYPPLVFVSARAQEYTEYLPDIRHHQPQ